MDCTCRRCSNFESLNRGMVKNHLLKHSFESDFIRWAYHGEINLTSGISELTIKNDGDVDQGNDSKSTEGPGDSAGLPNHTDGEVKDIAMQDQGPNQNDFLVSKEEYDVEEDQIFDLITEMSYQRPDDRKMLLFAFSLFKLMMTFKWDRESFNELISYLIRVFPMFNRLPICFTAVWNSFRYDNFNFSSVERGSCSSNAEWIRKVFDQRGYNCYACDQDLQSDACTKASSKWRNNRGRH